MELRDYLTIARKRWLSITSLTLLAPAAAVAATLLTPPTYTAHAQVYVSVRGGSTTSDLLQGSNFTVRQVKSYTDLVSTSIVLTPVIEHLDLATTPEALRETVTADSPLDTSLISIRASHRDPRMASDIANATADSLARQVAALEEPEDGPSPVEISTVLIATAPSAPSAPNLKLNVALGVLLGPALGFGLALLREKLDTRVRTVDDVHALTSSSVMTTIARDDSAAARPLVVQEDPHSTGAEAFRRLRTNLQFLDVAHHLRAIVVTSSLPGEGKSTVAANLAITLADAGSRVVLVDADLRRPSVAAYLDLEGAAGLTTVLLGRAELGDVVQPWGRGGLHVLPSGQVPPNPSELVGSAAMARVLDELAARYDIVVVDTPPLLPVTDAAVLARQVDGALVVAAAGRVHRQEVTEALGSLVAVGARVLGMVVNHLDRKQGDAYSYRYYRSETGRSVDSSPRRRRGGAVSRAAGTAGSGRGAGAPTAGTAKDKRAADRRREPARTGD